MIVSFPLKGCVLKVFLETMSVRIGRLLTFRILLAMIDVNAAIGCRIRERCYWPMLVTMVAVLFDLRLFGKLAVTEFFRPSMVSTNLFSKALKDFLNAAVSLALTRCGSTWTSFSF